MKWQKPIRKMSQSTQTQDPHGDREHDHDGKPCRGAGHGTWREQCLAAYICRNIYSICPAQPVIKTDSIASQTIKGDNVSFLKLHVDNHSNKRGAADNSDGAV